jgi:hypothetical protein
MTRPQIMKVVIRTKQDNIPVRKEGSRSPKKMKSFILTCLKRQKCDYPVIISAELKLCLPELSSICELFSGAYFIALNSNIWLEK